MMAMTAIRARPAMVAFGTIGASKRGSGNSAPIAAGSAGSGPSAAMPVVNHRHAADLHAARAGGHRTGPSARCRGWRCTTEVPDLLSSTNSRSRRCARLGSTLPVGSSASSSCGRAITARAIAARCFSPPERIGGSAHMRSPSPTQCSSSTTSSRKLSSVRAHDPERQRHVLVGGHVVEQAKVLEHDADPPPQRRQRILAQRRDIVAEQRDEAARRPQRQEQQAQQRGLARARGPGQELERMRIDPEASGRAGPPVRARSASRHSRIEPRHSPMAGRCGHDQDRRPPDSRLYQRSRCLTRRRLRRRSGASAG